MIVNGIEKTLEKETNLRDWLVSEGYTPERTAVVLNGEVVPRAKAESIALKQSDKMDIVGFVGGG